MKQNLVGKNKLYLQQINKIRESKKMSTEQKLATDCSILPTRHRTASPKHTANVRKKI